jgi:iron complex outermembrane receptor protein
MLDLTILMFVAFAGAATDTSVVPVPEIVVSATRTPQNPLDIPNATAVVSGAELRRHGIQTLAEALQDVVGLDTGEGSDSGSRLPNIGLWGLKEFDALLITLNGVPVGGPFNPSLAQIPIEDVDRIEIVKGPQGTLYGVSAFAGMVQVFTRTTEVGRGHVAVGGGAFSQGHGSFGWGRSLDSGIDLRLNGSYARSDGWQDRTKDDVYRGTATLSRSVGRSSVALDLIAFRDRQDWGTPMPYDAGAPLPGLEFDRNYAVVGALAQHEVVGAATRASFRFSNARRLENTLSLTHDAQRLVRSFPGEIVADTMVSDGISLDPTETSLYEDLRVISTFEASGPHELVAGTALTWGETKGRAKEFEFDQALSAYPSIPTLAAATPKDEHDFEDGRTFIGFYVHDTWTPHPRLSLAAGGRVDAVKEDLETEVDDPVNGPSRVKDSRQDAGFSGGFSALFRAVAPGSAGLNAANFYASIRRSFKPAAPNLTEAESAEILEPERTVSWEAGLKARALDQLSFNASAFDMDFKNMVVSILGSGGGPELMNAGEQRFKGAEMDLSWAPQALPGATASVGYAHHDARFVHFTFVTPDSQFRDVSGKMLELVPRDLVNARLAYSSRRGPGGFFAVRYQGRRPFNRRNTFFDEPYTECDAGVSFDRSPWRVTVVARNLGDDRHVTGESEIGDSQFYVSPPRRVTAEVAFHF